MSQKSTTGGQPGPLLSDDELLGELGARLAHERLTRNLTQSALAAEAGLSRATVRRLEGGHSIQLAHLIRILRALGMTANFQALVPEPIARPLEQLERRGRRRQRASSNPRPEPEDAGPWKWGEDA